MDWASCDGWASILNAEDEHRNLLSQTKGENNTNILSAGRCPRYVPMCLYLLTS
jgi:hypothetical protein